LIPVYTSFSFLYRSEVNCYHPRYLLRGAAADSKGRCGPVLTMVSFFVSDLMSYVQVIGRHLHTSASPPSPHDERKWDNYLVHSYSGDEIQKICMPSYEALPLSLKRCFVTFATFPEDHRVPEDTLVSLWASWDVASSPQETHDYARGCLSRLQDACLIKHEVNLGAWEGIPDTVVYYMHDVLRDLAQWVMNHELGNTHSNESHKLAFRFFVFQVSLHPMLVFGCGMHCHSADAGIHSNIQSIHCLH
jgi:hypothetical protein